MYIAIRFRFLWAFVLFLFVVILGLAGAMDPGVATATSPAGSAQELDRLRVAPESPRTGYSRAAFSHWVDADGDGCNTREEVLISESASPAQVDPHGCTVVAGDWFSAYDGVSVSSPAELQVDHVVALAEAWDSGAAGWVAERREAFANDLEETAALIAVTSAANQAKADHDPAQWRPRRDDLVPLRRCLGHGEGEVGPVRRSARGRRLAGHADVLLMGRPLTWPPRDMVRRPDAGSLGRHLSDPGCDEPQRWERPGPPTWSTARTPA